MSIGSFGDRFAKIAGIYGADVTKVDAEWGYAAAADEVRERLRAMTDVKAVLLTHNETSTGVMNPIAELAAAIRAESPDTLILVDSVSGLGAVPFEMDAWGVDVVVTGSQKAWMSAPGLAMIAASPRAWTAMESATMPRFYLDLRAHRDAHANGQTPFTPAIAVVYQVDEGLRLMADEGAAGIFARHEAAAAASRAGLAELGFELFADPAHYSRTVTSVHVPEGLDWKAFNSEVKARGVVLAGGQGKLTGKIFRLGHLGSVTVEEILGAIAHARAGVADPGPADGAGRGRGRRPARRPRVGRHRRPAGRGARVKVLVAESVAREGIELLAAHHEVDERLGCTPAELAAILPDYDALIVRSQVQVDAELIAAGTRLVVIGRAGVGVDNVDLDAATRAGITVVNAPTGNTIAAAEHTLALLYGVARKTAAADASMRRGEWKRAQFTGPRAARPDAGHPGPGQDRPGHRPAGAGHGDGRAGRRSVRDRRAGRQPRRRARRPRHAPGPGRRRHRARAPHPPDARAHRARGAGPAATGGDHPERRPGRHRRRGGPGRGADLGPRRGRRHRRVRDRATDRLAPAPGARTRC